MQKIFSNYKRKGCNPERCRRGFTLIELLVTISIIGILATIIFINLQGAQAKSRDTKRKSDLSMIMSAIVMYGSDHGGVLPDASGYISTVTGTGNLYSIIVTGGYMDKIPCDPKGGCSTNNYTGYTYVRGDSDPCDSGKNFGSRKGYIYTSLENPTTEDSATLDKTTATGQEFDNCTANLANIYSSIASINPRSGSKYNFKLGN